MKNISYKKNCFLITIRKKLLGQIKRKNIREFNIHSTREVETRETTFCRVQMNKRTKRKERF